jgi:hypothetical protein
MYTRIITTGLLSAVLMVALAVSPAAAQQNGDKNAKSADNCYARCNSQIPTNQAGRDRAVNTCTRSCRAGQ